MKSPVIVAEISGNHLGSQAKALQLIDAAWHAGADAVKFQCFTPEQMADPGVIVQSGPWAGRELLDLYRETHTPREWFPLLFSHARFRRMTPFSSVFHTDDVDVLETLHCAMYKISSFEILDLSLIKYAAGTGKPLIISTGMATLDEIRDAIWAARPSLITLLKCTSAYPASVAEANLETGRDYQAMFDIEDEYSKPDWGVSDHTMGFTAPVVATVLGATMIEKHLTLSRANGGPDAAFSSEPEEFAAMVKACREAAAAIGEVRYGPTPSEMSSLPLRRKPGGKRGG